METASLIITPNAYLEGKLIASYPPDPIGDMSVTRATTATRVNSAGLVELVPYNLLQYSQDFSNAYWFPEPGNSVTSNTTAAPDGTTTADTFTATSGNGMNVHNFNSFNLPDGTFTYSIYLKNNGTNLIEAYLFKIGSGFAARGEINFSAGTFTASIGTGTIANVGNGWYRVTLTNTYTAGSFTTGTFTTSTTGTRSVYAWGAQLVEGSVAKDYLPTTTRLNIPRVDYSTGSPALLVEPQRTNLALWSSSFDNAAWGLTGGVTITANNTTSPSGVQDADRYIESTNANYAYEFVTDVSGTFTASLYVKKASSSTIGFGLVAGGFSGGMSVKFNLDTQTFSTLINYGNFSSITASYEALYNGWYRLILTGTTATATSYYFVIGSLQESYAANTYIWGAQLEAGNYSTSYIPTTSASVTRNADVISKTGISSLIGQTEGTIFADFYHNGQDIAVSQTALFVSGGSTTDFIALQVYDGRLNPGVRASGSTIFDLLVGPNPLSQGRHKVALAYKSGDFAVYLDGASVYTNTNSATFGTISQVDLGHILSFDTQLGDGINAAALWKTRLTNTQLAQLTSI
jgi:hypothetical protein